MTFILYWHKFLNDYLWGLSLSLSSKYWPKEICPRPLILSEDEQKYHLPIGPRFGWSGKQCVVGIVIKQAVTGRAGAGLVGDLADPCRLGQGVNGGHWLGRLDTACSRFLLIWPIILLSKKIQHFKIKNVFTCIQHEMQRSSSTWHLYKLPVLFTSSDSCFLCFFIAAARGFAPPPNMGTAPVGSWRENTQFQIKINVQLHTGVQSIIIFRFLNIYVYVHGNPHF